MTQTIYANIAQALARGYTDLYYVNIETDELIEFNTEDELGVLTEIRRSNDFFEGCRRDVKKYVHPDDQQAFVNAMDRDFLSEALDQSRIFEMTYRRIKDGRSFYVQMRVSRVEHDKRFVVIAVSDIDELMKHRLSEQRKKESMERRLAKAESMANIDTLTGVKNKHAYLEAELRLDRQIEDESIASFAVVMMDVNDLKKVNDSLGHQAGDEFLKDACKTICDTFKHSPVFRVGGDEFVVIAQGDDYSHLGELLEEMAQYNKAAMKSGRPVIACGAGVYEDDACVAAVYDQADHDMYKNKELLKSGSVL